MKKYIFHDNITDITCEFDSEIKAKLWFGSFALSMLSNGLELKAVSIIENDDVMVIEI